MIKGFVLINIEPGREMETYEAFVKMEEVREVTPLLGDIDFILILVMDSQEQIAQTVVKTIRCVPGVVSTKTMVEDSFVKHFEMLM